MRGHIVPGGKRKHRVTAGKSACEKTPKTSSVSFFGALYMHTHFPPFHLCPHHHPLTNSPAPAWLHCGREGRRVCMNRSGDLSWMSMDHNAASHSSLLRPAIHLSAGGTLFTVSFAAFKGYSSSGSFSRPWL